MSNKPIENQRMLDLLRVCRSELFIEHQLIDELEYAWLASLPSVATHQRLADYDKLRARIVALENDGPGTPIARLTYLLDELEKRFPGVVNPVSSEPPEPLLLAALDKARADAAVAERQRIQGIIRTRNLANWTPEDLAREVEPHPT